MLPWTTFCVYKQFPTYLGSQNSPSVCVLEQVVKAPELQVLIVPSLIWWCLAESVQHARHER